jgi:hypothetical protein
VHGLARATAASRSSMEPWKAAASDLARVSDTRRSAVSNKQKPRKPEEHKLCNEGRLALNRYRFGRKRLQRVTTLPDTSDTGTSPVSKIRS